MKIRLKDKRIEAAKLENLMEMKFGWIESRKMLFNFYLRLIINYETAVYHA